MPSKMSSLNVASAEKKFLGVTSTQDGIQTLALWLIHHKVHHEKLVELWLKSLKKVKMSQRLTLFYVCNEVAQTCKRKHAIIYKDAFKTVLKDAVLLVRDNSVRPNIERIFNIWEERKIYDKEFIEELQGTLANSTKVRVSTTDSKLLAEFQPQKLIDQINSFKKYESEVLSKKKMLGHLRMDASSLEAIRQLKDRAHGKEFCQQFEDSCTKLEDYSACVEKELKERTALVEMLEHSQIFYDAQYSEAKIVANAYRNFGTRVNNLKKRLDEMKKALPDPNESPVVSPEIEAPSPENSPADAQDNTEAVDMDLSDEEINNGVKDAAPAKKENTTTTASISLPIPSITRIRLKAKAHKLAKMQQQQEQQQQQVDSLSPKSDESAPSPEGSPVDLDLPDDHDVTPAKVAKTTPAAAKAAKTEANPLENKGSGSIFDILHNLATGGSTTAPFPKSPASTSSSYINTPLPWETSNSSSAGVPQGVPPPAQPVSALVTLRDEGEGTPLKDEGEGGSTPVQDEASTDAMHASAGAGTEPAGSGVSNPIEFLTQLINQTKNTAPGSTDFLQNLSVLTNTMKTLSGGAETDAAARTEDAAQQAGQSPSSWASWKAQQQQQQQRPPPPVAAMATAPLNPPPLQQPIPMPIPPPAVSGMMPTYPPASMPMPMPTPPPIQGPPPSSSAALPPLHIPPPVPPLGVQPPPMIPPPGPPPIIDTATQPGSQPHWMHSPEAVPPPRPHLTPPSPLPPPIRPPMLSPTGPALNCAEPQSPDQDYLNPQLMRTPKGILRKARSNLTEIKTVSDPTPGDLMSHHMSRPTPPPLGEPLQSPRPPLRPPGGPPRANVLLKPDGVSTEQQEFIEKLKRKSSLSGSPSTPVSAGPPSFSMTPASSAGSNLRTLTQVPLSAQSNNVTAPTTMEVSMETDIIPAGGSTHEPLMAENPALTNVGDDSTSNDKSMDSAAPTGEEGELDDEPRGTPIATIGPKDIKVKSQVQKINTLDRRDWVSDRKQETRRIESVGRRVDHSDRRDGYSDHRPAARDQYDRRPDYYQHRDAYDPYTRNRDGYYRDPYARPPDPRHYYPPQRRY